MQSDRNIGSNCRAGSIAVPCQLPRFSCSSGIFVVLPALNTQLSAVDVQSIREKHQVGNRGTHRRRREKSFDFRIAVQIQAQLLSRRGSSAGTHRAGLTRVSAPAISSPVPGEFLRGRACLFSLRGIAEVNNCLESRHSHRNNGIGNQRFDSNRVWKPGHVDQRSNLKKGGKRVGSQVQHGKGPVSPVVTAGRLPCVAVVERIAAVGPSYRPIPDFVVDDAGGSGRLLNRVAIHEKAPCSSPVTNRAKCSRPSPLCSNSPGR